MKTSTTVSGSVLHQEGMLLIDGLGDSDVEGAVIAGRLLTAGEVRSVTIDHQNAAARVQLQQSAIDADTLSDLASLVEGANRSLASTTDRIVSPEILCWRDGRRQLESYFRAPKMASGLKRTLYLIGAGVTFALAAVGVLLPGLPTTPFLLLTSYCLLRSSRRMHERLLRSKLFGPLLRDWHTHRGVRPGIKAKSLAALVVMVGATIMLSGLPAEALYGIGACSMIGVVCICRLRVIREG